MCDQGIKDHKTRDRMNRTGHVAPANRAKREILPVETDTGKVYNGSAGKKVGALTGKESMSCTYVESGKSRADLFKGAIVKLISHIDNEEYLRRIYKLAEYLCIKK